MQRVAAGDHRRHRLAPARPATTCAKLPARTTCRSPTASARGGTNGAAADRRCARPSSRTARSIAIDTSSTSSRISGIGGQADRDQDQEGDQRDEAADHEDVAMGEIDHADDAVDHRVADGDQAVDGAQRDAVDQLLSEIFHALPREGWGTVPITSARRRSRKIVNSGNPQRQPRQHGLKCRCPRQR